LNIKLRLEIPKPLICKLAGLADSGFKLIHMFGLPACLGPLPNKIGLPATPTTVRKRWDAFIPKIMFLTANNEFIYWVTILVYPGDSGNVHCDPDPYYPKEIKNISRYLNLLDAEAGREGRSN